MVERIPEEDGVGGPIPPRGTSISSVPSTKMKIKVFKADSFIREYILSLKKPKKKIRPQIIVAPYGPSCVGKSTVMKALVGKLPLVRVSNDELRILLRKQGLSESLLKERGLFEKIAAELLKKKHSLVLDANFASSSGHLAKVRRLLKRFKAKPFLVRVTAPKKFVIQRIKKKKWLTLEKGGLLATKQEAIEHFLRSSKQYNYERLMPQTSLVVNPSKQIEKQIRDFVRTIRKESIFY